MSRDAPRPGTAGFALTEALVALLLLAVALLGAAGALIESLAAQQAALLQTRAADLASDLAEALRSSPDDAAAGQEITRWQQAALQQLPLATPEALHTGELMAGSRLSIRLGWRPPRSREPDLLQLRVALPPIREP